VPADEQRQSLRQRLSQAISRNRQGDGDCISSADRNSHEGTCLMTPEQQRHRSWLAIAMLACIAVGAVALGMVR
jgi:hypothetical protein